MHAGWSHILVLTFTHHLFEVFGPRVSYLLPTKRAGNSYALKVATLRGNGETTAVAQEQ